MNRATLTMLCLSLALATSATAKNEPSMTEQELAAALRNPVVEHKTDKGSIFCRDPQVKFDEEEWATIRYPEQLKEHVLVDLILNKRLLHRSRPEVDLYLGYRQELPGTTSYSMFAQGGRKCGNAPSLILEVVYDENLELVRYRSRYSPHTAGPPTVDSDWVVMRLARASSFRTKPSSSISRFVWAPL